MEIVNSTITENALGASTSRAGSAIYVNSGIIKMYNNTIVNNTVPTDQGSDTGIPSSIVNKGSAVYLRSGTVTMQNNIIANNSQTGSVFIGRDLYVESDASVTESYNIIGAYRGTFTPDSSDKIGNSTGVVYNLNLASDLAYLGGKTMSYRVLANSWAIDHGTDISTVTGDQRGNVRPGSGWTIGSYELLRDFSIVVNTDPVPLVNNDVGFDFTNNQGGWLVSLRTAAFLADVGTVTIDHTSWTDSTINLVYGGIRVAGFDVTIEAAGTAVTIDGSNSGRIFNINSVSPIVTSATLSNLVLENAYAGSQKNDLYIDAATGMVYLRCGSVWTSVSSVIDDTSAVLSRGAGAPDADTENSYYLDVATGNVYQKNADTEAWTIYKYADGNDGIKAAYEPDIYVTNDEYTTKNGDYVIDQSTGELYQMINGEQSLVKDLTDGFNETLYTDTKAPGKIKDSKNGDVYVNTKTGDVYQMTNGSWGSPTENIIGTYSPYMLNGSGTPALGSGNGGAIFSNENLTLSNVTVQNNNAANSGGGIYVSGANLTLADASSIYNNNAGNQGGGIYINAGNLNLTGNSTSGYSYVTIFSNSAELGGGVYAINANVTADLAKVYSNTATYGGGFDLDSSLLTMSHSEVYSNTSTYDGGGLLLTNAAKADVNSSTIADNVAGRYGAGIYASVNELNVINSTLSGNLSGSYGGGIFFAGQDSLNLTYSTLANNIANTLGTSGVTYAGGGVYQTTGTFNMIDTILAQNYQTSASDSSRDDYYASSSVNEGSITYSIIGENNKPGFFDGTGMIEMGDSTHPYSTLGVSTVLENLGGPTRTLWVSNSSVALDAGTIQTVASTVTTDQRGITRVYSPVAASTIGAYEKNIVTYVFNGTTGNHDVYDADNWTTPFTGFYIADAIYQIAAGTAEITSAQGWDVGYHSSVDVTNNSTLLIDAGAAMSAQDITVESAAAMTILGSLTYSTDRLGSANAGLKVNDTANLTIGTRDDNIANADISLGTGKLTTVQYTYAGNQTVRNLANYGNVIISNSGSKNAAADLTIDVSLTVNNGATLNAGTHDVTVVGTAATDVINITDSTFTSTGALNANAGNAVISNSSVTAVSLSVSSGNMTLDNVTITAPSVTVSGALGATGGTTSTLTSPTVSAGSYTVSTAGTRFNVDFVSSNFGINDTSTIFDDTLIVADNTTLSFSTTSNASLDFDNKTDNTILGTLEVHAGTINPITQAKLNGSLLLDSAITLDNTVVGAIDVGKTLTFAGTVALDSDISLSAGSVVFSDTITGKNNSLGVTTTIGDASFQTVNGVSDLTVTTAVGGSTLLYGDITATGATIFNSPVNVSGASTSISANSIDFNGTLGGNNLSLTGTNTSFFRDTVNMSGNLTLSSGAFTPDAGVNITSKDLNIASPATTLTMGNGTTVTALGNLTNAGTLNSTAGSYDVTVGGNLTNTGTLSQVDTADVTGNLVNSNSFAATTANITGNITNSGTTFNATTVTAHGNMTNTSAGSMTVGTLWLDNANRTSTLSLNGIVNVNTLGLTKNTSANLTSGNLSVTNFTFANDAASTSRFSLGSSNLKVTNLDYGNNTINTYNGNYFVTTSGGTLTQTVDSIGTDLIYRVGGVKSNGSNEIAAITLNTDAGESVSIGLINSIIVRYEVVTGIADTSGFTTNVSGTTASVNILSMNWDNAWNGSGFNNPSGTPISMFQYNGGIRWADIGTINVVPDNPTSGRSQMDTPITLSWNGSFAVANTSAEMTGTWLNGNIALFEMSNPYISPRYDSFYLDINNLTNFPIGQYPYFSASVYPIEASVGRAIYDNMAYRMVTNPLTNMLGGQVPPIGSIVGQAITEGASLTLTSDAPVYLEVNGEYSIGAGWLPFGVPGSAGNIEQYQSPITQGQLDEFYLDFGGREDLFETPASFRSDLDEMLDNLLAG